MQKWEYMEVFTRTDRGSKYVDTIDGQPMGELRGSRLVGRPGWYSYRDRIGSEGWELVNADNNGYYYIFKRPIE